MQLSTATSGYPRHPLQRRRPERSRHARWLRWEARCRWAATARIRFGCH